MKSLKTLSFEHKVFRKISAFFAKKADASLSEINSRLIGFDRLKFLEGKTFRFTNDGYFVTVKEIQ
jgi:hypothetical protein